MEQSRRRPTVSLEHGTDLLFANRDRGLAPAHGMTFGPQLPRSTDSAFVKKSSTSPYAISVTPSMPVRNNSFRKSSEERDFLPIVPEAADFTTERVSMCCGGYTVEPDEAASPASSSHTEPP